MTRNPEKILAVETAIGGGSLALFIGGRLVDCKVGEDQASRSAELVKEISQLLDANALSIKEIELIVGSRGPGSFTGLRVGLATLRGLSFAVGCPLLEVSASEALAHHAEGAALVVTLLSGGRGKIYFQSFDVGQNVYLQRSKIRVVDFEFLKDFMEKEERAEIIADPNCFEQLKEQPFSLEYTKRVKRVGENLAEIIGLYGMKQFVAGREGELLPLYISEN